MAALGGSPGHARASRVRSMAAAFHCRRATTLEKKLGQKLRFGRTKCPPTVRSQSRGSPMAARSGPLERDRREGWKGKGSRGRAGLQAIPVLERRSSHRAARARQHTSAS